MANVSGRILPPAGVAVGAAGYLGIVGAGPHTLAGVLGTAEGPVVPATHARTWYATPSPGGSVLEPGVGVGSLVTTKTPYRDWSIEVNPASVSSTTLMKADEPLDAAVITQPAGSCPR